MDDSLFEEIGDETREAKLAALDELFEASRTYRDSKRFHELIRFIARFRKYSPYNCCILQMQRPSVSYVATPRHWRDSFNRTVKTGAHPLVILAPMHPIMFVFDIEDTEGDPLPKGLVDPFFTDGQPKSSVWERTVSNLPRDRIKFVETEMERTKAGTIGEAGDRDWVIYGETRLKALYRLQINSVLDPGGKYATLAHELGHLYAGHRGTPDERWWPSRTNLTREQREFEAESICFLVCERAGVKNESDAYLSGYLNSHHQVPEISLDRVLKAAWLIECMGKKKLQPRK